MGKKVLSLAASIGMVVLGIYLSLNTSRLWYGLVLAGVLYGIYEIYLIATHGRETREQQERERKLAEQGTFGSVPPPENAGQAEITEAAAADAGNAEHATIVVRWFKDKMGLGAMPVQVNGEEAGVIKKGNLQVTYLTRVPFNVIHAGVYKAEIELSPGDTVEYFVAGNGIRHERTTVTRKEN